ncbi:hypothetical protein [Okeania sp. KiyG1]|uniref:hypothetical protein n=1 Tax=Okeania sp. KiyG1 TaxID=2720165 RepID=UPI001922C859|nr:hypothetical protein [Okeania sp. KiyG1]
MVGIKDIHPLIPPLLRGDRGIGKKSNSEFVPIATARLKERIAQLCDEYGIIFIETEESYTCRGEWHSPLRF